MISIKDYAKSKNVSYEAVRKQVNRYKKELEGHISKVNRTQYLDDEAVALLDEKRQENPIIIIEADKDERIKELEAENKILLAKITMIQEELLQEKEQVKVLQNEKIELLEQKKPKGFWSKILGK